jgi:hypothetical protein
VPDVELILPPEQAPGVYANFLIGWHSPYEFTLDFCVTRPMGLVDDDGDGTVLVVARVRLPVALIFDVIRTLNDTMTEYESEFGEIRPPESREEES